MTLEEALARLRGARAALERRGVVRAAVFGSVARGEATAGSDVDVFVEISPDASVGIWELAGVYNEIADAFCR
ncbi:MAG TPA: nucleotidyltransferase domain-containing protein [Caulobacterales bacterium]|nr:nucleotidyltransferase domain-containing protein [Caulobacterales bacterium]